MLEMLSSPDVWLALLTLTILEIVLGIDNVIFIAILTGKLPAEQRNTAQLTGLSIALITRLALLVAAAWIMTLDKDLFTIGEWGFSGHDLILLAGGIFLVYKATHEIHEKLEGVEGEDNATGAGAKAFWAIIGQILVLDVVFSIDGVITAVGMTNELWIMIVAVVVSSVVMVFAAKSVSGFVERHPTVKMLALSFLVLIGAALIAEGFGVHMDKAFIYGPMAFSVVVETLNITYKKRQERRTHRESEPVHLHQPIVEEKSTGRKK
ncbi:MAG: TerC family protein [Microbacteriaceae bacterium]